MVCRGVAASGQFIKIVPHLALPPKMRRRRATHHYTTHCTTITKRMFLASTISPCLRCFACTSANTKINEISHNAFCVLFALNIFINYLLNRKQNRFMRSVCVCAAKHRRNCFRNRKLFCSCAFLLLTTIYSIINNRGWVHADVETFTLFLFSLRSLCE